MWPSTLIAIPKTGGNHAVTPVPACVCLQRVISLVHVLVPHICFLACVICVWAGGGRGRHRNQKLIINQQSKEYIHIHITRAAVLFFDLVIYG